MISVCQNHMTKGIRTLSLPHVKKISESEAKTCVYCEQKASVMLYIPYLSKARNAKAL